MGRLNHGGKWKAEAMPSKKWRIPAIVDFLCTALTFVSLAVGLFAVLTAVLF